MRARFRRGVLMRLLAGTMSLALGFATTATLAADPPQAAASPPAAKAADAAAANTRVAATPLRLQLSQSELATLVSQPEESAPNNGSAAAEDKDWFFHRIARRA